MGVRAADLRDAGRDVAGGNADGVRTGDAVGGLAVAGGGGGGAGSARGAAADREATAELEAFLDRGARGLAARGGDGSARGRRGFSGGDGDDFRGGDRFGDDFRRGDRFGDGFHRGYGFSDRFGDGFNGGGGFSDSFSGGDGSGLFKPGGGDRRVLREEVGSGEDKRQNG